MLRLICAAADRTGAKDEANASIIETLSLSDVLAAYDAHVLPSLSSTSPTSRRRKLSIHLIAQQSASFNEPSARSLVVTEEHQARFKAGLQCSAAATPVERNSELRTNLATRQIAKGGGHASQEHPRL